MNVMHVSKQVGVVHQRAVVGGHARTPEVYAIELLEFPKEIPIACRSVGDDMTPLVSSWLILSYRGVLSLKWVKCITEPCLPVTDPFRVFDASRNFLARNAEHLRRADRHRIF